MSRCPPYRSAVRGQDPARKRSALRMRLLPLSLSLLPPYPLPPSPLPLLPLLLQPGACAVDSRVSSEIVWHQCARFAPPNAASPQSSAPPALLSPAGFPLAPAPILPVPQRREPRAP